MKKHSKRKRGLLGLLLLLGLGILAFFGSHLGLVKKMAGKVALERQASSVQVPEDALSFSVYDLESGDYLFYAGDDQQPTVASLSKLFTIEYALTKLDLEEVLSLPQEVLDLVPEGSSLAHLTPGDYTVQELMEGMLVPSGNDAAYALAYGLEEKEHGPGLSAEEAIDRFVEEIGHYLRQEGYTKTHLFDPSGFSSQADTNLSDINRVAQKLLHYDFVRDCIGKSQFSIETPQGTFSWKNTNAFLDPDSPYYNPGVKGMKTGTMSSSYSMVVLYEEEGHSYLITCLAARSNPGRYQAVQSAIQEYVPNYARDQGRLGPGRSK